MKKGTILLAAGGTGGHLFPAEALAHELVSRGYDIHLASDERVGRFAKTFPARKVHQIASATFGSRNPLRLARAFLTIWQGVRQSSALIASIGPRAVVGFGGYPTLPPLYAATRRRVPTLIHEQNAVMGRANKALSGRVGAIAGGFLDPGAGPAGKVFVTGNPVRPAVIEAARVPYEPSGPGETFRLLVFGGSQGAQFFSEAVPAAIGLLREGQRGRLEITQQARAEDVERVRESYRRLGVRAEVAPFFQDLPARMAAAHLVISRSGASTVSELAAIGRPALLVPYPHALDHDQAANAAALEAADGAEVLEQGSLSPGTLAEFIAEGMNSPDSLVAMAKAAKTVGRLDAARLLADLTEAIASGKSAAQIREATR
jgi:UDP-N-acetylglucosamine--N-acetylmuramyl-(pentapeptide) pyrophosphoryl-undecaprenol N-acetylglucosamine transferase